MSLLPLEPFREQFLHELIEFCRQPSISSTGEGMPEMCNLVADYLHQLGADVQVLTIGRSYPYIVADIGSGSRTLMVYNHYDVQPARREDGWDSEPFQPTIRDGRLYARGVADNKAHMLSRIQTVAAYLRTHGALPLRVRFVIEGEEEIGSPHLIRFAREHNDLLQADGCLWESGRKEHDGRPMLHLGVRGILYVELSVHASSNELHSSWANIVENPSLVLLDRLRTVIASLSDEAGRPTFSGLLDDVAPPTADDLALLEDIPFDVDTFRVVRQVYLRPGLDATHNEALRRVLFEPSCNICGIQVGYGGRGMKTIIPNRAVAKMDFRLPPGLTPDHVEARLREHLHTNGYDDVQVRRLGALQPARTPATAAIVHAAREAVREAYHLEPIVYPLLPASGPMYELCHAYGIPALSFGTGHAGDNVHAANENIYLEDYFRAMQAFGSMLERFAASPPEAHNGLG